MYAGKRNFASAVLVTELNQKSSTYLYTRLRRRYNFAW